MRSLREPVFRKGQNAAATGRSLSQGIIRLMISSILLLGFSAAAEIPAPGAEIPIWQADPTASHTLLVLVPGMDPDWWGRHADISRDHFLRGLLAAAPPGMTPGVTPGMTPGMTHGTPPGGAAGTAPGATAPPLIARIESLAEALPLPPDSLWSSWRKEFLPSGEGLILCGLLEDPPKTGGELCLWVSSRLREIADLSEGLPEGDLIRPERIRDEIRQTGGILRIMRAEEAREILALPRAGLEAFQNLPASLEDHPMARLKRVFLGDKLFVNAGLYTMSVCPWKRGALHFGLVQAYRDAILEFQDVINGEDLESG
ncbi:MAG: hypothetical protein KJ831_01675, partial [Candidatus Eisenbacteria bacterium]|nr:hypothetical protein [Candidatus Eisenbacteria bacterium]